MESIQLTAITALREISEPGVETTLTDEVADFLEVELWDDSDILEERSVVNGKK